MLATWASLALSSQNSTINTTSVALDRLQAAQDAERYIEHVRGAQVVGWSYAAAVTFLIYDVLITLDTEVQLIWPVPWSVTKLVFFFIRYFPIMLEMSTQFYGAPLPLTYPTRGCYVWNVYQGLSSILIVAAVDYILILRVYGMYPRNKPIRYISAVLYLAELVTVSVGLALAIPKLVFDEHCVVTDSPGIFLLAAGCPIVYQAFLFAVTIVKFIKAVKNGWGNVPIVQLLIRDGTWAFILLFVMLVSEAALYGFAAKAYTGFLYGWINTAFSICGYRIILNLHTLNLKTRTHRQAPDSGYLTNPNIQFTTICTSINPDSYQMSSSSDFPSSSASPLGGYDNSNSDGWTP